MGFSKERQGSVIEFHNVSKAYAGSKAEAVSGLTLSVPAGEFLVLIGASGSGKTTTLNMVNRLVEPDQGEIRIDGRNVSDSDPVRLRRGIGYVFQEAGLFPHMTVAENIAVTPLLLGWDERPKSRPGSANSWPWSSWKQDGLRRPPAAANCPAASASGWHWPGRWRPSLRSCCWTSRSAHWIRSPARSVAADVRDIHQRLGLTTLMVTHDMTEALLAGRPDRGDARGPAGTDRHAA